MVWGLGQRISFGKVEASITGNAKIGQVVLSGYAGHEDGSGYVAAGDNIIGVDFSKACGAEAVVAIVGPGAAAGGDGKRAKVQMVEVGGQPAAVLTLSATGTHPEAKAAADAIVLGGQTIQVDGAKLTFGKTAGAAKAK